MKFFCLLLLISGYLFLSCNKKEKGAISFYYWKTNFLLSAIEMETLNNNNVKKLYIRYFDIDKKPGQLQPMPVSPVLLSGSVKKYDIIPVIYIKNRVFENADTGSLVLLAQKVFSLVNQINQSQLLRNDQIQFDCDWTEKTKQAYFRFLEFYRSSSKKIISATIRLHQVKYYQRTGVPPVDFGVLMYYNMNEINPGLQNSIYDKATADRYKTSLGYYPLSLDVALPVFCWGQQIREGQVVQLLNKLQYSHFKTDTDFVYLNNNRFKVIHACFKAGYYFRENDLVKLESVSEEDLLSMASTIKKYSKKTIKELIFYDLDSINIVQYEKDVYKKVLDNLN